MRASPKVLMVDDTPTNLKVLEALLTPYKYTLLKATSGREAMDLVNREQPDLVLLDILMPEMDGYELLQQIKRAPATRDIPVIMISSLDTLGSVVRCIEQGAEDFLPKPFEPALLRARIGACLEKKRLRDAEVEYLREVERVIEAATAVEAGTYEPGSLATVANRADELGRLARVFDSMVAQLRAREARLRGQLEVLKREIGEARRGAHAPAAARPAPAAVLAPGDSLAGRYRILEVVGAGGMGVVYKAHDRELGEDVAVKVLRREFVSDPTLVERFKREIRLARHISHPNVVRMHDLGESGGVYYLTMEYVEGITVRELIDKRGRLDISATLAIGTQLAESLGVAHRQGIIHRDVKPENLLLDAEGLLKVMDFGVARLAQHVSSATQAGLLIGTPAYMAPEQLLEEPVDCRADLYAAGVVMYECLTGRLPYEATSVVGLVAAVIRGAVKPPTDLNPAVPAALSAVVMQLMQTEADKRPRSAAEVGALLAQLA
ncbi:MAG: protein kinase [Gemmatimonadaceae bacterium]